MFVVARHERQIAVPTGERDIRLKSEICNYFIEAHAQPGTAAQPPQLVVQIDQARVDEFDPEIAPRQCIEDLAIEHEHAPDLACAAQRVAQRGVVAGAQVAANPDQRAVIRSSVNREVFDNLVSAGMSDHRYTLVRGAAGVAREMQYRFAVKPRGTSTIAIRLNALVPFRCYLRTRSNDDVQALWVQRGMWAAPHAGRVVLQINSASQVPDFLGIAVEEHFRWLRAVYG